MSEEDRGFSFRPAFEGVMSAEPMPDDWCDRMQRRLAQGLLVPGRRARANYRVASASQDVLVFEAVDFGTASSIGLNHVELRRVGADAISYKVGFARWNHYAIAHSALVGACLAAASFFPKTRAQIESHPLGPWMFWGMVSFWALAWPWILTAVHRNSARDTLESILLEELEEAEPPSARSAS
jgi:hypothetical protein